MVPLSLKVEEEERRMPDTYGLYGMLPKEREENEAPMSYEQQLAEEGEQLLYETDDRDEATALYQAGGFERDGKWHVITRVENRTLAGGGGAGPVRQSYAAEPPKAEPLSKDDFI